MSGMRKQDRVVPDLEINSRSMSTRKYPREQNLVFSACNSSSSVVLWRAASAFIFCPKLQ